MTRFEVGLLVSVLILAVVSGFMSIIHPKPIVTSVACCNQYGCNEEDTHP